MRFTTWLWEQLDLPGQASSLANICWSDVNNGCASAKFTGSDWLNHFNEKHPDTSATLSKLFMSVYLEFLDEVRK